MMNFKDLSPNYGVPVWLWWNGRWTIASLSNDGLKAGRMEWLLLGAEILSVRGDHIWSEAELPLDLPPPGSFGDQQETN